MISQSYDLNMIPGGVQIHVPTSQYDAAGSRTLLFNLYYGMDGFGTVFTIPSGAEVYLDGTKPGGKSFRYTMTIVSGSTNQVSVDIDEQMTAVKGEVLCQVTIEKNKEILGSANFILDVEEAALKEGSDMSESIIAHIIKLVEEAGAAAALAKRSAEEAEQRLADLGILSSLTTDAKTNLVDAINEVDSHTDSNTTAINQLQESEEFFSKETEQRLADLGTLTDSNTTAISQLNSNLSKNVADGIIDGSGNFTVTFVVSSSKNRVPVLIGGNNANIQFLRLYQIDLANLTSTLTEQTRFADCVSYAGNTITVLANADGGNTSRLRLRVSQTAGYSHVFICPMVICTLV